MAFPFSSSFSSCERERLPIRRRRAEGVSFSGHPCQASWGEVVVTVLSRDAGPCLFPLSWFRHGVRAEQVPRPSESPTAASVYNGSSREVLPEAADHERIPVLRVPGHRPPLEPAPDG